MRRLAALIRVKPYWPVTVEEIQVTCYRYVQFAVYNGTEFVCDMKTTRRAPIAIYTPMTPKPFEYDVRVYAYTTAKDFDVAIRAHGKSGVSISFGEAVQTLFN